MNIVFFHTNFPGQFLNLAPFLAKAYPNSKVVFVTEAKVGVVDDIFSSINVCSIKLEELDSNLSPFLAPYSLADSRAKAAVKAIYQLKRMNIEPDLVIAHGGTGFDLLIKAYFPQIKLISYQEWYMHEKDLAYIFGEVGPNEKIICQSKNGVVSQEIYAADKVVVPTPYQLHRFPDSLRLNMCSIFDGINESLFRPRIINNDIKITCADGTPLVLASNDLILSYATRGMEPLRGFPEFMRAAAEAQKVFPHLKVVIAGTDRVAYSYCSQTHNGSWKETMLDQLSNRINTQSIYFTGLLSYGDLALLFNRSNLHVYFSRPYVPSWGLFQAIASGANLLANKLDALEGFLPSRALNSFQLIDLDNQDMINNSVIEALSKSNREDREPKNCKWPFEWKLNSCMHEWKTLIDSLCF